MALLTNCPSLKELHVGSLPVVSAVRHRRLGKVDLNKINQKTKKIHVEDASRKLSKMRKRELYLLQLA